MGTVVRRLLVNDMLSALPDHRTFWNDLQDWFDMEFVDGEYKDLTDIAQMECGIIDEWENIKTGVKETHRPSLIIRNASYFGPLKTVIPTISLLQDIFEDGSQLGLYILHDTNPETEKDAKPGLCDNAWEAAFEISSVEEAVTLPYCPGLTIVRKRESWGPS